MWGAIKTWRSRLGAIPLGLLTVTLLVLLSSYSIYSIWLSVQPFAGQTVNLAGRQRMLSQQIAKQCLLLVEEPSVEGRIRLRQSTYEILTEFRRVQHGLDRGDKSLGLSGENTAGTRTVLARMTPNVTLLAGGVETIYRLSPHDLLRLTNESSELRGILGAADSLIVNYDDFLREYIAGAEREIVRHKVLEIAVFIAAFLVILQVQFLARGLGSQIRHLGDRLSGKSRLLEQEILARRSSEEERRLMVAAFEQANDSIIVTDASGKVRYVNPAFARSTGYSSEEILGKTQSVLNSGEQDSEFYRRLWNTIGSGQPWRGQMVNRRKDGTLHIESQSIFPIRDGTGHITHYAGIKRDITREVEMEKQLRESQRLEAIGVLASGVAHDFNNLLTPILGHAQLLASEVPVTDPAYPSLEVIRQSAERAADLTRSLLAFGRKQPPALKDLDLNGEVSALAPILRRLIGAPIEVRMRLDPELGYVSADPSQIQQVILNLAINARDAMPAGGTLTVETANVSLNKPTAGLPADLVPGNYVSLSVRDTGQGMDAETRSRIFEPFFTTKPPGKGTGLGLSIVFGIVIRHKGYIAVDSAPGQGSRFTVYLPRKECDPEKAQPVREPTRPARGVERVLIVDDEEGIRNLVQSALTGQGYDAVSVASPEDALALIESPGQTFALLITDSSMPGMNGPELARRARQAQPCLKILCVSGNPRDFGSCLETPDTPLPLLAKPFSVFALYDKVREVLDGAKPSSPQG